MSAPGTSSDATTYQIAVAIDWDCCVIVISSSSCENTGCFRCSLYRSTHWRPYVSQSGRAKLTASLKLNYNGETEGVNNEAPIDAEEKINVHHG